MAINWRNVAAPDFTETALLGAYANDSFKNAAQGLQGIGNEFGRRADKKSESDLKADVFRQMAGGANANQIFGNLSAKGTSDADLDLALAHQAKLQGRISNLSGSQQQQLDNLQTIGGQQLASYDFNTEEANRIWDANNPISKEFGVIDGSASPINLSTDNGLRELADITTDQWGRDDVNKAGGNRLIEQMEKSFEGVEVIPGLLKLAIAQVPLQDNLAGKGIATAKVRDAYDILDARHKQNIANQAEQSSRLTRQQAGRTNLLNHHSAAQQRLRADAQAQNYADMFQLKEK